MISNIEQNAELGPISFTKQLLNLIFKLSLVNFNKKKSTYALDKNFEEIFKSNKSSNSEEFYNCVLHLNNELISIEEYLSDAIIKKEFKRKDIFLELLFDCVNNCLSYCKKNINYNNNKTKDIIREFINYMNSSLEYNNNIKNKIPQKFEEKKANDMETDELKKKLETLEILLND